MHRLISVVLFLQLASEGARRGRVDCVNHSESGADNGEVFEECTSKTILTVHNNNSVASFPYPNMNVAQQVMCQD